jgi:hypothetical protein
MQATLGEHSGNIFREHLENIRQGTFRKHSGNIQATGKQQRTSSGNIRSGNIEATFRQHAGNMQATLRQY